MSKWEEGEIVVSRYNVLNARREGMELSVCMRQKKISIMVGEGGLPHVEDPYRSQQ